MELHYTESGPVRPQEFLDSVDDEFHAFSSLAENQHSPLRSVSNTIRPQIADLLQEHLQDVRWEGNDPLTPAEFDRVCDHLTQQSPDDLDDAFTRFSDALRERYLSDGELDLQEQSHSFLQVDSSATGILPFLSRSVHFLFKRFMHWFRGHTSIGETEEQSRAVRGRQFLEQHDDIVESVSEAVLDEFVREDGDYPEESILGKAKTNRRVMNRLKKELCGRVRWALSELTENQAQSGWSLPLSVVRDVFERNQCAIQLDHLHADDFPYLRDTIADEYIRIGLSEAISHIDEVLDSMLSSLDASEASGVLLRVFTAHRDDVTFDIASSLNGPQINEIRNRVLASDIDRDLSNVHVIDTVDEAEDLKIIQRFLTLHSIDIASRIAPDAKTKTNRAAADMRNNDKVVRGGPLSRVVYHLQRRPEEDYTEMLSSELKHIARMSHQTVEGYVLEIGELLDRPGSYYIDECISREALEQTQHTLPKLIREARKGAINRVYKKRKISDARARALLGPETAEIYRRVWTLPIEQRGVSVKHIADEVYADIDVAEVRSRDKDFPKQSTRERIRPEVEAYMPQMQERLVVRILQWLQQKQASDLPLTKKQQWALSILQQNIFNEEDFEMMFADVIETVVEMHLHARDEPRIVDFFEAHLSEDDLERILEHKLGPWVQGIAMENSIPRARHITEKVMRLLEQHARQELADGEHTDSLSRQLVANKALAELRISGAESFEYAVTDMAVQLAQTDDLNAKTFKAFADEPERFFDIPFLYDSLFGGEIKESLRIGGREISLDRYYKHIETLPKNSVTVVRYGKRFVFCVGPISSKKLRDRFTTLSRGIAEDVYVQVTTACSSTACDDAPRTFTVSIQAMLSAGERYGTGAGRLSAGQHFHYQGIIANRQNDLSAELYLAMVGVGFCSNEVKRFPIPNAFVQKRKEVIAQGQSVRQKQLTKTVSRLTQRDGLLCDAWAQIDEKSASAYAWGKTRDCMRLCTVARDLSRTGRANLYDSPTLRYRNGAAILKKYAEESKQTVSQRYDQLMSLFMNMDTDSSLPTLTLEETSHETYTVLVSLPRALVQSLDPNRTENHDHDCLWMFTLSGNDTLRKLKQYLEPGAQGYRFRDTSLFHNGGSTLSSFMQTVFELDESAYEDCEQYTVPSPGMAAMAKYRFKDSGSSQQTAQLDPEVIFVGEFKASDDPFGFQED